MEDNGNFKEIYTVTGNEILTPKVEIAPKSKDEIVFKGKVRSKLSSLALVFGILCIFGTFFYGVFAVLSVMLTDAPGSSVPNFVFVIFYTLPVVVLVTGITLLILRHIWVKQLVVNQPSDKTRLLIKFVLGLGVFFIITPALIIFLSIVYMIIVVPISLILMIFRGN